MSEVESPKINPAPWSLEMSLRKLFKGWIDPVASFLLRIGLKPNFVTGLGLVLSTVAGFFVARGEMTLGGILLILAGPLDVVDGTMARMLGQPSPYGAFVDSVTDRYSELVVLGGLLYFYAMRSDTLLCILVFLAAGGSVMVSYIKARAEALGFSAKIGILTRVERLLVLAPCLLFNIPNIAIWIIALLANFTAIQRFIFVRRQAVLE
ncbi:MAG: CDP-alcohol phosphatidyltransferase family protein [Chloroflexi bacterium]|nr:CDP-alcohol phosphatidyltransferase family protein [Chloroflexota bacterium]